MKTVQRPQKTSKDGYMQRDKLETEEYAKACSTVIKEVGSQDGIDLIDKVIDDNNLLMAWLDAPVNKYFAPLVFTI
ncbi:hypothetical protein P9386_18575 [Caldifermentibacillus hisashii]|uniref:hypothetical protein n=1 Tax=Caldifermentibacillus hisashii TaxID=996558 RepID=UPI002E1ECDFF|nr:hypothetical protein [Caldifermentibacillus hisashii]